MTYYQLGATSLGSMPTTYFIKEFPRSAVTSSNASSIDTGVAATTVAGPFNMLDAPFASGYFTGDYQALIATRHRFHASVRAGRVRHSPLMRGAHFSRPARQSDSDRE